ncbi:hypothetical protein ACOME3_009967 [Neoechinorhynchus agilis]
MLATVILLIQIAVLFGSSSKDLDCSTINGHSKFNHCAEEKKNLCFVDVECSSQFVIVDARFPFNLSSKILGLGDENIVWHFQKFGQQEDLSVQDIHATFPTEGVVISQLSFDKGISKNQAGIYKCTLLDQNNKLLLSLKFYVDVKSSDTAYAFSNCYFGWLDKPCFEPYFHPFHSLGLLKEEENFLHCAVRNHNGTVAWLYEHDQHPSGYMIMGNGQAVHLYMDLYDYMVVANREGIYTCILLDSNAETKQAFTYHVVKHLHEIEAINGEQQQHPSNQTNYNEERINNEQATEFNDVFNEEPPSNRLVPSTKVNDNDKDHSQFSLRARILRNSNNDYESEQNRGWIPYNNGAASKTNSWFIASLGAAIVLLLHL